MFEMPYDRKRVMLSEIESFVSRLQVKSVLRTDLIFEGKEKDDRRFPNYDKIVQYVSNQSKTEAFVNNLLETAEQLKRHFTSNFSKTYPVSFAHLDGIMEQYDEVLLDAAQVLMPSATADLDSIAWEKTTLSYAETQDKYLWFSAGELIERIEQLAKKIAKFIKLNNLYGNSHKYHPAKRSGKFTEKTDFKDELESAISKAEKILKKQYIVDIMDDGTDELKEMLTCLWNSIEVIMCAPLFIESYDYFTAEGSFGEAEMFDRLSAMLQNRYSAYNHLIDVEQLLGDETEERIFEVYKDLIQLDKFGFLVPVGTTLVNIEKVKRSLTN
jgi:hypothetical protein